jgi:hypothetical protein
MLLLASTAALAPSTLAAEPTPTQRPPTCAQRYPATDPEGVDRLVGCIMSQIAGLWRPGEPANPPTLSAYGIALAALVAGSIGLGLAVTRLLARRASASLAPTTPDAWWVCPNCHSVNGLAMSRCYACGGTQPADAAATAMPTSDAPETRQSFGRGKFEQ